MQRSQTNQSEAKIGYPDRFLSAAQVCPVSSGHTIASVRRIEMSVTVFAYPCDSGNGFHTMGTVRPSVSAKNTS